MPDNKLPSYGLLIGVGQRTEDIEAMGITAGDATWLTKALSVTGIVAAANSVLLTNEKAAHEPVLAALSNLATRTKEAPAEMVIIYFSGHGARINGQYYLVCHDTTAANIASTGIKGEDFVERLAAIRSNNMLVLLDCCHAGGITETDIPFDEKPLLQFKNRVILTACAKQQYSYLSQPVSLFTYALIESLCGKFLGSEDKNVTIFNLAMDVRERVVGLSGTALAMLPPQQPQLNVLPESETTNFVVAPYPNGRPLSFPLLQQELAAITSENGKGIDLTVKSVADTKYRQQFNWLQNNNIIINNGNGNYIVQGTVINNGLSEADFKQVIDTLRQQNKAILDLLKVKLQQEDDTKSKQLLARVQQTESINELKRKGLEEQLLLLTDKKNLFEKRLIKTADPGLEFSLTADLKDIDNEIATLTDRLNKL